MNTLRIPLLILLSSLTTIVYPSEKHLEHIPKNIIGATCNEHKVQELLAKIPYKTRITPKSPQKQPALDRSKSSTN